MIKICHVKTQKNSVVDITADVLEVVKESGVQNGIVTVMADGVSFSIALLEANNAAIAADLEEELKRLVPSRITFRYELSPDSAAGRIKSCLFGASATAIVQNGALACDQLGFFVLEHSGASDRGFYVSVIGE